MFRIEIKRQVTEVVQFLVDEPIQEKACDKAYDSALADGGEIISREHGNYTPHIIKIEALDGHHHGPTSR